MRLLILLSTALVLVFASVAQAGDVYVPTTSSSGGCHVWTLCSAQTSTGVCVTGADNNILDALDGYTFSAFVDTSTSTDAWTVKLYDKAPGAGYHATRRTLVNASGDLTTSNMKFSWSGTGGDLHAEIGGTLSSDAVTVIVKGCKL